MTLLRDFFTKKSYTPPPELDHLIAMVEEAWDANMVLERERFTRHDVALLRACADSDLGSDITLSDEQTYDLRALADRIERTLLP